MHTEELWTLLNFVSREEFKDRGKFIEAFGDLKSAAQLEMLHKSLKPYVLRREKEHVEKSVPPKEEILIDVELTVPQKQYYRAIYEQNAAFLYKGNPKDGTCAYTQYLHFFIIITILFLPVLRNFPRQTRCSVTD